MSENIGFSPTIVLISHASLEIPLQIPSRVIFRDGRALVILLFALCEADFHFDESALQVHFERHERESLLLDGADQAADFTLMHEQFPHAERVFVENIPLLIGIDVHPVNKNFSVPNINPALLHGAVPHTERLDLRAEKLDSGLERLKNKIVEAGFFIVRDEFFALFSHASPLFLL